VLEALARCLFQNLLLQAHVEAEEEAGVEAPTDQHQEPEVQAKSVALDREGVAEECT